MTVPILFRNGYLKIAFLLLFCAFSLYAKGQSISGKVTDVNDNIPLVYVNIGIVGTSIGIISNEKCEFNLNVKNAGSGASVRFSMIGYEALTFAFC